MMDDTTRPSGLPSASAAAVAEAVPAVANGGPLRICILTYRGNPRSGGQGIYTSRLSEQLLAQGHSVTVVSGPPWPELAEGVKLVKIPGLNLFDGRDKLTALQPSWLLSPLATAEWMSALCGGFPEPWSFGHRALDWLREHADEFDVLHDNQTLCYGLLKMRRLLPLVATIHHPITRDLELQLRFARNLVHRLLIRRWHSFLPMQKRVVPQLEYIVAPSERSRADTAEAFGVAAERIAVAMPGVAQEVFQPMPDIEREPHRIMTTTSADVPLKGLDTLLKAMVILRPKLPQARLTVVGRPRPGGHTERIVQSLGLGEVVEFAGALDNAADIARLYARSSLAVVPSLYEGFGLPAAEAMSCGVPLVVSDGGSLPEVVGKAGLVVAAGDEAAMAEQMLRVLRDDTLRQRLAKAGIQRAGENFRWEYTAEKTVQLYRRAIQSRPQPSC